MKIELEFPDGQCWLALREGTFSGVVEGSFVEACKAQLADGKTVMVKLTKKQFMGLCELYSERTHFDAYWNEKQGRTQGQGKISELIDRFREQNECFLLQDWNSFPKWEREEKKCKN